MVESTLSRYIQYNSKEETILTVKTHHEHLHKKYAISGRHWQEFRYTNSPTVWVYTRYGFPPTTKGGSR